MRRWLLPTLVPLFVMAGYLKGIPTMTSLPIDFTLAMALAVWFAMGYHTARTGLLPRQIVPILVVFLVLAVPLLWTHFTEYGTEKVERLFFLTLPACLAPIVLFTTSAELRRLILAWAGVAGFIVATAILYPVPDGDYANAPIEAVNVNTIGLGRAAGIVLVVAGVAVLYRRGRHRMIAAVVVIGSAFALLASGSRGPLLAVILALAAAFVLVPRRRRVLVTFSVVVLFGGSLAYAFHRAPEASRARILAVMSGSLDNSSLERLNFFSISTGLIKSHPLGLGWGGFEDPTPGAYRYPHDLALEALVEAGWIPGLILLGWLGLVWARSRRLATDPQGAVVFGLLNFTIVNALVSGDVNDNRILFLALGLCIFFRRCERRAKAQEVGTPTPLKASEPLGVAY